MRVLVSGVAGDIGLGVGRVLKDWGIFNQLFGIDISNDHPAKIFFDYISIAPRAEDLRYVKWLCNFIEKNNINLFIPTSEAEILVVSNNLDQIQKYAKVLINNQLIVDKCLDKSELMKFLASNGIVVPSNGIVGQNIPEHYPVITKPRKGQGSKGLKKINCLSDFNKCTKNLVWQEYLVPSDQEYTCAVYVSKNFKVKILLIKRLLINGYTGKGVIVKNKKITDYIMLIVKVFNKPGCYNIQLILTKDGPRIFEINPRLSSTLVFRDKLGFNDLRWWISELIEIKYSISDEVTDGTRIYRGNSEYIISNDKICASDESKNTKKNEININLEKVLPTLNQMNLLYSQLKSRLYSISHETFPTFEKHKDFVKNNPYRAWFLVKIGSKSLGNVYIQFDNSVGLNLIEDTTADQIQKILSLIYTLLPPLDSVPSLRYKNYYVNISSKNINLQNKLNLIKCREIQRSYVLPNYLNEK